MKKTLSMATIIAIGAVTPALASNVIAGAIAHEQSVQAKQAKRSMPNECVLLESMRSTDMTQKDIRVLAEQITKKLKANNTEILRARGDASRKGIFGFSQNYDSAFAFYAKAAENKSPDAGYNAALMLYQGAGYRPDATRSNQIISLLQNSGALDYNVKGLSSSKSHYIAGRIYDEGRTGARDIGKAFLHYRASARSSFVPAAERYIQLLLDTLPGLSPDQRKDYIREMQTMLNRWKWSSAEMMRLLGDAYAAGWLSSKSDKYQAQYHWRIASGMQGANTIAPILSSRLEQLKPDLELRLKDAVQAALRNSKFQPIQTGLEFAEFCIP